MFDFLKLHTLQATVQANDIRTDTLKGEEYLVVPVIAVKGDIVWEPTGSPGPTHVPVSVLEAAASTFNGRPVTLSHPPFPRSANERDIIESQQFGVVLNSRVENNDLVMEAWLRKDHAESVGATDVYDNAANKIPTGVSIGFGARWHEQSGINAAGVSYRYKADEFYGDHLAALQPGEVGACSIKDGCQMAKRTKEKSMYSMAQRRNLLVARQQAASIINAEYNGESSLGEKRAAIEEALRLTVPAFSWIPWSRIYLDQGVVFYETYTESSGEKLFRTTFELSDSEGQPVATVPPYDAGKPRAKHVQIQRVVTFEPVTADDNNVSKVDVVDNADDVDTARADDNNAADAAEGEESMSDKSDARSAEEIAASKKVVDRLIACDRCAFEESDRDQLESLDAATLEKFASTPSVDETNNADDAVDMDKYVAKDSPEFKRLLDIEQREAAREQRRRDENIAAIKASNDKFDDDFFDDLSNDKIAAMAEKLVPIKQSKTAASISQVPTPHAVQATTTDDDSGFKPSQDIYKLKAQRSKDRRETVN